MATYKFETDFGEMGLLEPMLKIHGRVGIIFDEAENITSFVMPVILDIPGPTRVPWIFENIILPITWEPVDIESWGDNRLAEHEV